MRGGPFAAVAVAQPDDVVEFRRGDLEDVAVFDRGHAMNGRRLDVDAIAGTSVEAHRAGLELVVQAGGTPISWVSLACELQRDWARLETVEEVVQIVLTERLLQE